MAADFNKPVLADAYASVLQSVRDLAKDLALMLDNTGTQNIPSGAIKWNSTNARFEKYNGSAWAALTARMSQDVTSVMGYVPGNGSGALAINNGTLNTNLNAEMVGGLSTAKLFQADYLQNQGLADANSGAVRGAAAHYIAGTNKPAGTDHALLTMAYSAIWAVQMAGDWRTNDWYVRNENNGTWGSWQKLYHTGNFTPNATAQNNIGAPGTYGAATFLNNVGSWAGFRFGTGVGSDNRYFMTNGGQTGEYDSGAGAWQWRFDNGTMSIGTVPWTRLSGVPSFNYLSLTGGTVNGTTIVNCNGTAFNSANETALSVRSSGSTTAATMSFHRPGNYAINVGLDTDNYFKVGGWSAGSTTFQVSTGGHLWGAAYGWLHDYFTRTVNAGSQLTGGGSGSNLTISHASVGLNGAPGLNAVTLLQFSNGHVTNCNCNCNCGC